MVAKQPRSWSRRTHAILLAATLLLLSGCSSVAVFLGLRIRLDKLPVTAVSASLVKTHGAAAISALAPGQSAQLVIVATTQDGKQYPTVGAGKGKVAFDNYTITVTAVQITKKGKITLPADPRVSEGKVAQVHIVATAHPDIATDLDIPIRYDFPFVANYSGAAGASGIDGMNGSDGLAGLDGTPGDVDPTTGLVGPRGPGGRGSDGGNGQDGSDGQNGAPGATVHVWVRLESPSPGQQLLQVKVDGDGRQSFYLVDTHGGTLQILDNGGAGGRGGRGGRGGQGGSGGSGDPPGMSGLDGHAGWDGKDGADGPAGIITLSVDPAARDFMSSITWVNHSGGGRAGLPATVNVEAVGPLW